MSPFAVVTLNDVPAHPLTFKYDVLGELSRISLRRYCQAHGYDFIDEFEIDRSRPACWTKVLAVSEALKDHDWVLWADSDTLVRDGSVRLEDLVDPGHDLIVQYQEHWWDLIGLEGGTERFPINSGVFLMRSSPWSTRFLAEAYAQSRFVRQSVVWDGIGEQEAMNHLIRANPDYRRRIKYVDRLQTSPGLLRDDDLLVHFYGNHAPHHIPPDECREVLRRWRSAIEADGFPDDVARFHWCCIQNKDPSSEYVRGDLAHYRYSPGDIDG